MVKVASAIPYYGGLGGQHHKLIHRSRDEHLLENPQYNFNRENPATSSLETQTHFCICYSNRLVNILWYIFSPSQQVTWIWFYQPRRPQDINARRHSSVMNLLLWQIIEPKPWGGISGGSGFQLMVWAPVVWIPIGSPLWKGLLLRGTPRIPNHQLTISWVGWWQKKSARTGRCKGACLSGGTSNR